MGGPAPRPRKERSFGPVQGGSDGGTGFLVVEGEGEKGRSHSWISDHARSLTALWMGITEGMVRARWVSADWEGFAAVVVGVLVVVVGLGEVVARRAEGLCLRRTAVKNCCSEG